MKVTFVCLGNMCRSPLLEQMFSAYAESIGLDVECDSAGLLDHIKGMSAGSVEALIMRDITPKPHLSKLLSDKIVSESDYIFTMTDRLKDKVVEHFGNAQKVISLTDKRLLGEEVKDPYGLPIDAYFEVAEQFDILLPRLAEFLKNRK